jgi:uncharacterized 2Fe-2S/4Fe-4S cluster protein (DUF4445 family)
MNSKRAWVHLIDIEKPGIQNNTADVQRLEKSLKQSIQNMLGKGQTPIKVRIPFHLIKHLPGFLRTWDFRAKAVLFRKNQDWLLLDLLPPESEKAVLGAALDIGTTRIEIALIDLQTGVEIAGTGFDNPQAVIGPDILTRIHYSARADGLEQLSLLLTKALNQRLDHLCRSQGYKKDDIYIVAGAGNTAMTHLFAGIEAFDLIKEPYIPCTNIPDTIPAQEIQLDINEKGIVYLFPNIGSYFGGDLIAGILYSNLDKKSEPCLMVDVGTNAEIVVGCKDFLLACAGAAGPALEGGVSKIGMTARPGVIDKVWLEPDTGEIGFHTIEDKAPIGICGSGMIDLAAALFLSGRMDIRGRLVQASCKDKLTYKDGISAFILTDEKLSGTGEPIVLSQVDLNSLTSSKAAMFTILEVIVKHTAGLDFHDLEKFLVAGTFGSFINPVSAISIGMLPDIPTSLFEVLGNSSLGGCKELLSDPEAYDRILNIRNSITYIELNVNQEFMNLFSGAKFYPHTDASRFPTIRVQT